MKRVLCLMLAIVLCLNFAGCTQPEPTIHDPVEFYYRCTAPEGSIPERTIAPIKAEAKGLRDDTVALLNLYLRGATEEGFDVTFPASTKLLSITFSEDTATLNLNASLARLTGIDLTLACACLTMTTIGLTGVRTVCIRAANETLDGAEQIIMDENCLTLLDSDTSETTE